MSMKIALGFLGDHVGFQIHIARRALRQAMRPSPPVRGPIPSSGTISSLVLIGLNPGISQQDLADALFLDSSKVALLVRNLCKAGLVRKCQSAVDLRKTELRLTDAGAEHLQKVEAVSDEHEQRISQGLTAPERRQLVALLVKLQQALR